MNFDNFQKALSEFQTRCNGLVQNLTTNLNRFPKSPPWARITPNGIRPLAAETIEQRLEGVPVYALSNAADEFMLVSGASTGRNLGLFCFNKEDAEALLHQVTAIDPLMPQGSKVVPVALNKVRSYTFSFFFCFDYNYLFIYLILMFETCLSRFFRYFNSK